MAMRATILAAAAGLGLLGLAGCVVPPYGTAAYPVPATTTTTTVVRDAYGNPISTTQASRDANGNPIAARAAAPLVYVPGHYQE
jgi:hypothetical protein